MKKLTKKAANDFIQSVRFTTSGRFFSYNMAVVYGFSIKEADRIEKIFRMADTNMTKSQVVDFLVKKYNKAVA